MPKVSGLIVPKLCPYAMMGTLDGKSQLYHLSTIITITVVEAKMLRMKKNQKNHRHSAEVTVIILLAAFLNPSFVLLQTWHWPDAYELRTSIRIKQGKIDSETFCQKFGFHICPNKEHEFLPEILRFFMHHTLSEIICWFSAELRQCMWNNAHTQPTLVKMGVRGCWLVGCEVLARFQSSVKYF